MKTGVCELGDAGYSSPSLINSLLTDLRLYVLFIQYGYQETIRKLSGSYKKVSLKIKKRLEFAHDGCYKRRM
jgi:hypothetical protein